MKPMKDFFISYNKADRSWAEWIAWVLEDAGYSTVIQSWDFRPGSNFVLEMDRAANDAGATIAVISDDYLSAAFTQSEWAAAFADDPLGNKRKLIPVRVKECSPTGLLKQIVYLDIVGLGEGLARTTLIQGLATGRNKPSTAPKFPGSNERALSVKPDFPNKQSTISLFISYSHRDERFRDELSAHLSLLTRQGVINEWHDRKIQPGNEWGNQIDTHLDSAQIILLLISADFIASDYCYDKELLHAMEKHDRGSAIVIPVILRPCDWFSAPFGKLQALPRDGKPITSWSDKDEALASIAQGIRLACRNINSSPTYAVTRTESSGWGSVTVSRDTSISSGVQGAIYNSIDVFKYPGVPNITFVEPDKFYLLKNSLRQPGLGVVIEGPSGIGKTTALRKAAEQLKESGHLGEIEIISARKTEDVKRINHIEQWHKGVLAVDDFHRLGEDLRSHVADYLKHLADRELPAKLIVVGIPGTERRLIEIAFDLGTRIRCFKLGKVSDEIVLNMIDKGEKALNISFDRKFEIALAAGGSLNIAQILCSNLVAQAGIDKTQPQLKPIHCDVETAVAEVMDQLIPKYADITRCFASLGGHSDRTCIGILEELAQTDNGVLSLPRLKDKRYDLAAGIDRFISDSYISGLEEKYPDYERYLYYDHKAQTLAIDDPQLRFYLVRTPSNMLERDTGKL